jgi:HlyD family secretion protein
MSRTSQATRAIITSGPVIDLEPEGLGYTHRTHAHTRGPRPRLLSELYLIGAALAILALAQVAWLLWPPAPTASSRYVTSPVLMGDLSVKVSANGTVEPTRSVDVSTEISGTMKRVLVKNNDPVKVGQLLAELDTSIAEQVHKRNASAVQAAKARIKEAEAEMRLARRELSRKSKLARKRYASRKQLDKASSVANKAAARIEVLKSELAVAEADLRISASELAKAQIKSPIDGVVLQRNVQPGQTVAASLSAPVLFQLAENLSSMQLRVDVDEADALRVEPGQSATFDVFALRDQRFEARVEKLHLGAEVVDGVVTYKAILSFDNHALQLKPGMTATADIVVNKVREGLMVPNAALRFVPPEYAIAPRTTVGVASLIDGIASGGPAHAEGAGNGPLPTLPPGHRHVFVEQAGKVKPIVVEVGATDGTMTHIVSGPLKAGQAVAVDLNIKG